MKIRLLAVSIAFVLAGCGGGGDKAPDNKPAATKATPTFDAAGNAQAAEAAYVEAIGGRTVEDQCDAGLTNWQCFYTGVKAVSEQRLDIELSTPGDISEATARAFSEQARMAYFNFIGEKFPKLDRIVTFVNGTDTGTLWRADVFMLNRP